MLDVRLECHNVFFTAFYSYQSCGFEICFFVEVDLDIANYCMTKTMCFGASQVFSFKLSVLVWDYIGK